jgi:hypothetical protein
VLVDEELSDFAGVAAAAPVEVDSFFAVSLEPEEVVVDVDELDDRLSVR